MFGFKMKHNRQYLFSVVWLFVEIEGVVVDEGVDFVFDCFHPELADVGSKS